MSSLKLRHATEQTLLQVPRVREFFNLVVAGERVPDAARKCKLTFTRARNIMRNPHVRREYFSQLDDLRTSERGRNILAAVEMRERAMEKDATAAQQKVGLEAMRYLDGDKESSSITINGNVGSIAGYVINLEGDSEGPRDLSAGPGRLKPLIEHEE